MKTGRLSMADLTMGYAEQNPQIIQNLADAFQVSPKDFLGMVERGEVEYQQPEVQSVLESKTS